MPMTLLDQARQLNLDDRIALAEAIWESIPAGASLDQLPLQARHRELIDRRLEEVERAPGAESPWEQVRTRLARKG